MGLLDKLETFLGAKRKDFNLLVVGLDNSGKSSIVNALKPPNTKSTNVAPTVGFSEEKINSNSLNFTIFDMSGQSRYRNLWEHYFKDADAIVFVIDSADRMRLVVSREELENLLNHPEIRNKRIPLLIYANKKDVKGAISVGEIRNELELDGIKNRGWRIFGTNALNGDGINEGLEWLSQELKETN